MKNYIVYNQIGKIQRTGICTNESLPKQAGVNEFAMEGAASDVTQKIVDGKIIDKTPAEILIDNPPPPVIPDEDKPARMTKKEVALLMQRVKDLEDKASGNP